MDPLLEILEGLFVLLKEIEDLRTQIDYKDVNHRLERSFKN